MALAAPVRAPLYTTAFVTLLVVTFLGFAHQWLIQPILPALVLDLGGDATTVGLIMAAFSLPSVVLRPLFGRLVDEWHHRRVYLTGALTLALSGAAYAVSGLVAMLGIRILHGSAWAAFNTAGGAALAKLAPTAQRGEAASMYSLMPGLAQMVGPPIGLLLLAAYGFGAPLLAAAVIGLIAAAVIRLGPLRLPRAEGRRTGSDGRVGAFVERSAVLPMALEFLFTLLVALFWIYPPVFAASLGLPVSELTLYYLIVGATLVGGRIVLGRNIDRFTRRVVIAGGAGMAVTALLVAIALPTLPGLTIAGAIYALAASFTPPILMAAAIDRAEPHRTGAAMATYTLGFQLAHGVGAAVWGVLIDLRGYPAPYVFALGTQALLIALLAASWSSFGRGGGAVPPAGVGREAAGG